ncbi:MAG: S8 family serine peptidase [Deltaproteobacteria bacterium]|nr:S8 family serine peptidase [Deltaproteobacteria bacterium]
MIRVNASLTRGLAWLGTLVGLGISLLVGCGGEPTASESTGPEQGASRAGALAKISDPVRRGLEAGQPQDVLLVLDGPAIEKRESVMRGLGEPREERAHREERRLLREEVFRSAKADVQAHSLPGQVAVLQDFGQLPVQFLRIDSLSAALALASVDDVVSLHENLTHEAFGDENLSIINQPAAIAAGYDGTGATVAVLDTGLDFQQPEFGACAAPGLDGCKVVFATDFAPEDGLRDDPAKPHGTAVSATVAAVAPGVKLIGLDVFQGPYAYEVDLLEAFDWVIQNREAYGIEAVNMSLGGGKFTAACGVYATSAAIKAARDVGVLSAVASGNEAYIDGIAHPSCAPAAVSVGATTTAPMVLGGKSVAADTVTYYSNSSAQLVTLAPGSVVNAIGYGWHGTSFAAPHVAAAIASLAVAFPDDTPDFLQTRLTATGKSILDARNKRSFPRVDLAAATQPCIPVVTPTTVALPPEASSATFKLTVSNGCDWTASSNAPWATASAPSGVGSTSLMVAVSQNGTTAARQAIVSFAGKTLTISQANDATPPVGAVTINGGAQTVTTDPNVNLAITGTDLNGVPQMCVSNGTTCIAWEPFAATKAWKLAAGDGKKTVRVWLRDGVGNVSKTVPAASITLDTTGPTGGTLNATKLDQALGLGWTGIKDALSGVASYKLVFAEGAVAPTSCLLGTTAYEGSALTFTHTGLVNGTVYSYRVCGIDTVGKMGPGVVASGKPVPFTTPPVGAVSIADGAVYTKTQAVTLTFGATSQGTVTQMCVSNATTCAAWIPYATTHPWTLTAGNGTKTVRVWFRDEWGNTTTVAVADTIVWDSVAPVNGSITLSTTGDQVKVAWSTVSDAVSGVASYTLVYAPGTVAPACTAQGALFSGVGTTSFVHTGLAPATAFAYRICASDKAGNTSVGTAKTITTAAAPPPPEPPPPSP